MLFRARLSVPLTLATVLATGAGCGSAGTTPIAGGTASSPAEMRAEPKLVALRDSGWERVRLARLALTLELPDAAGFREGSGTSWARLEHAASESRLELSLTRAERLARPEDCEARARLERPELPRPAQGEALDERRLAAPADFLTQVTVSVNEAGPSELEGHVTAFGAAVSRCLALHFVTRVRGVGSENEMARRLGLIVERVLPSLAQSTVDERVSPQPFPRMKLR